MKEHYLPNLQLQMLFQKTELADGQRIFRFTLYIASVRICTGALYNILCKQTKCFLLENGLFSVKILHGKLWKQLVYFVTFNWREAPVAGCIIAQGHIPMELSDFTPKEAQECTGEMTGS